MRFGKRSSAVLGLVLSLVMLCTGCSSNWITVALKDLPVLTQMALNIASLVSVVKTDQPVSAQETTAIDAISAECGKDLGLLETLISDYQKSPTSDTLQKIDAAIGDLNSNVPALLTAAHIKDAVLASKVSAAISIILLTVNTFAVLMPTVSTSGAVTEIHPAAAKALRLPGVKELKQSWAVKVGTPLT